MPIRSSSAQRLSPLARLLSRIGTWSSIRFPLVWRTRTPLAVSFGLFVAVGAVVWARLIDVHGGASPSLTALDELWTFFTFGLFLLLLVDVARRSTPIFGVRQMLGMLGCVAVSLFTLLLPRFVFMVSFLPRIAAFQTEARLAMYQIPATLIRSASVAAIGAVLVVLYAGTTLARSRATAATRRTLARWTWRLRIGPRIDRKIAARWPILWSSRIPSTMILGLAVIVTCLLTSKWKGAGVLLFAVVVLGLYVAFRNQDAMRHLAARPTQEAFLFLTNGLLCALTFGVAVYLTSGKFDTETVGMSLFFGLGIGLAFQAARSCSARTAYGGMLLASGLVTFTAILTDDFMDADSPMTAVAIASPVLLVGAMAWYSAWREMRPTSQRVLMSTLLVLGPLPGLGLYGYLYSEKDSVTYPDVTASIVVGIASSVLVLHLTERIRRSLAYTTA